ncbi:MAG TPA: Gfo/Idh/MocA family oxidoreductase [Candidatus Lokiarchaeia archaeon]|nr:Gfo/Idh/MocA family oxidoreductase [Candidatus Lokiarchaeia archaeon]
MEKPFKVGIIGVGSIAQCHARGFLKDGRATIVNVCDLIEDEATTKAKKWGAATACTDYHDLLKDDEVQVVDILLPPSLHAKVAIEAAEAGKHILTEKPLATTLEDCDAVIEAAKKNNVKLMVCHNQLFYPPHQEAKRLVDNEIGNPVMSTSLLHGGFAPSGWRENPVIGGGFLLEACIHRFYVSRYLMGEVKRVSCMTGKTDPDLATENVVLVNLQFENNRFGTISANRGAPPALWDDRTEVVGEDGMVIINGVEDHILGGLPLMLYKDGAWKSYMTPRVFGETLEGMDGMEGVPEDIKFTENEIDNNFVNTFYYVIKHFLDCIEEDKTPFVSGEEGRRLVEIMLAAYKSAEMGQVVDI